MKQVMWKDQKCSKAAVLHSSSNQQQRDASIGYASNDILPPDKLKQKAYI